MAEEPIEVVEAVLLPEELAVEDEVEGRRGVMGMAGRDLCS